MAKTHVQTVRIKEIVLDGSKDHVQFPLQGKYDRANSDIRDLRASIGKAERENELRRINDDGLSDVVDPSDTFDPIAVEMMSQPDGPLSEEARELAGHLEALRQSDDHMGIFRYKLPSLFGEVESDGDDDINPPDDTAESVDRIG